MSPWIQGQDGTSSEIALILMLVVSNPVTGSFDAEIAIWSTSAGWKANGCDDNVRKA